MDADERRWMNQLSEKVIGCAFEVSRVLGPGFLEKVYQRALHHELELAGLRSSMEHELNVNYKGIVAGRYLADLLVEDRLLIELKCVDEIAREHMAQTLNYLKGTDLPLGLVLNFQRPKLEIKRVVHRF